MSSHNEDTRVKIPALVHFTRLGYNYVSKKTLIDESLDTDTNIHIPTLRDAINKINNLNLNDDDVKKIVEEIKIIVNSDDLGREFYKILIKGYNGIHLIDFSSFEKSNNVFQVVTELPCKNGEDSFRPDITVLINGIPLAFVEVKKPNNKNGIQAEYTRMNVRGQNKKFRRFINMMQLMLFSNNAEYDDTEFVPLEGAFYATTAYSKLFFSHFREEDFSVYTNVKPIDTDVENFILKDTNFVTLKSTKEYVTNTQFDFREGALAAENAPAYGTQGSSTNRIITSMFSHNRFLTILKYGLTYVEKVNDEGVTILQKHIMRYPQFFATKAIEKRLSDGGKNGIIWHTQGSGKTALAYYNVRYLTDYYQKQNIIAKFFFIVDRLDLATQAADEFRARGLEVVEISDKEAFAKTISSTGEDSNTGVDCITVVNIQKFSSDAVSKKADYNVNIQRIYFMDEAHRSYNPTGSFLGQLVNSDRNAIKIALTGTPLIGVVYDEKGMPVSGKKYDSKTIFGDYIHKYYYNKSVLDRYTLRLMREGITTSYRKKLQEAFDRVIEKGSLPREDIYAHPTYVKELVRYITDDFYRSRIVLGDSTIGGMIVCDSSKQAKAIFEEMKNSRFSSALILHDVDDIETRKANRNDFKKGLIDFLIVYNMLLTGFDAPRLKKLYLGRKIKDHSLLQALTRVNRPYESHRYGYVVDFADIRSEFDKTNKAYFDELQAELGDAFEQYDSIFKSPEEIEQDLQLIKDTLFMYNIENKEVFSKQISSIDEKEELIALKKALSLYKELYNVAKLFEYSELTDSFDIDNVFSLYNEVANRIDLLNQKELLSNAVDMSAVLNLALEDIQFSFQKVAEHEMVIADQFRETLDRARKEVAKSLDTKDPEYANLLDELQRLLKKKNIEEMVASEMKDSMKDFEDLYAKAYKQNQSDLKLAEKYGGDVKFLRTHKRIKEKHYFNENDRIIWSVLSQVKESIDNTVLSNERITENESYFKNTIVPYIAQEVSKNKLESNAQEIIFIGEYLSSEYIKERDYAS